MLLFELISNLPTLSTQLFIYLILNSMKFFNLPVQPLQPTPILIEGKDRYVVQKLLIYKKWGRKIQFFIRYKGYNTIENTWDDEYNILEGENEILR